jgi:DNA-binding CsgD family transcriptional regulator
LALKSAPQAVELGHFTELVRFGLTDAESGVAAEILKGDGRLAAARRLGISDTTAKTHLSNIFEKTGTRRQAELVRLILDTADAREIEISPSSRS